LSTFSNFSRHFLALRLYPMAASFLQARNNYSIKT
jgi:hypothetical protein